MIRLKTDVLVLGGGAAGVRAAVSAKENGADVVLAAPVEVGLSGSTFSPISRGWGIQVLVGKERTSKRLENFYEDIIRVGLGDCDPKLVRILVEESGPCVEDLLEWGLKFKKREDGAYLRNTGCFSHERRAFMTRDFDNIQQVFSSILRRRSVTKVTGSGIELILSGGQCRGAWMLTEEGKLTAVLAKATVLATGGGASVYLNNMGHAGGFADGCAMAHRAGAGLVNLEFIQFALGLKHPDGVQFLSIDPSNFRDKVVDSNGGCLFKAKKVEPSLFQRAVVERTRHMPFSCRSDSGWVDITIADHILTKESAYYIKDTQARKWTPIAHVAHAFNGGVKIDEQGQSSIPGLFAAGEVAAGPHGADRIGGCMMTATQVFGRRAGYWAAERAKKTPPINIDLHPLSVLPAPLNSNEAGKKRIVEIEFEVKKTMQTYAMVIRTKEGLLACREKLEGLEQSLDELCQRERIDLKSKYRVTNLILLGKIITQSALERKESRGGHFRKDFPPLHLSPDISAMRS